MSLLMKIFDMNNHREVVVRTFCSSLLLAMFTGYIVQYIYAVLFPGAVYPAVGAIQIVTFLLTMFISFPVLYGMFFMSLKVSLKNHELFDLANLDPLTGIYNRRALIEKFAFLFRKARRTNAMGALLVIDVDNFKAINDKFGHDVGDQVLIHLAATLRALSGVESCFARLGGEEFAAARFGVNEQTALEFAERIRLGVQNAPLKTETHEISFTVSIGYCFVKEGDTLNTVMRNADNALYTAKRTGRNRTVLYIPDAAPISPDAKDLIQVSAENNTSSQLASSK
jgi:diguanylate cyclase (GGDEF)-like protein